MRRSPSSMAMVLGVASFGCRPDLPPEDPTRDAIHLGRVGHDHAFGRGEEPERPDQKPVTSYVDEAAHIERLVQRFWVHQPSPPPSFRPFEGAPPPTSREAYAKAIGAALCALGDPHLRIAPGPTVRLASGLRFAWVGEELTLIGIDERYEHPGESPNRGDVVVLIDGKPIAEWAAHPCWEATSPAAANHQLGAHLAQQTRAEGDAVKPRELTLRNARAKTYTLPVSWNVASASAAACVSATKLSPALGRVMVHDFDCRAIDGRPDAASFSAQLDRALAELEGVPDVVLDLRDARGDTLAHAERLAQAFGEPGDVWLRRRTQDPEAPTSAFSDVALPPFDGAPVAAQLWIAIDPGCSGVCELVAAYLSTLPAATPVGQATAGAVGTPKTFKLPFSALTLEIPFETYALPGTDTPLQGRGLTPHVEVLPSAATVQAGHDATLAAIEARLADRGAPTSAPH